MANYQQTLPKARPYIVLVEDNPDDERLTIRALRDYPTNPRVEVARDGEEALVMLDRFTGEDDSQEVPNLVLLDLKLPKVSGHEVLQAYRAREKAQDVPIVILSSSDDEGDIRKAWSLGANDYMRKPMDLDDYATIVFSAARMWLPA